MSAIEVVLLVIGVAVFAISFFLPEKKTKAEEIDKHLIEEAVRNSVHNELEIVRSKIEDIIEETSTYSMEKTERALERISNEKMMAINEYSDTVLGNINKSHEEVMFLYDMLNQKNQSFKKTAIEAQAIIKNIEDKTQAAQIQMANAQVLREEMLKADIAKVEAIKQSVPVALKKEAAEIPSTNESKVLVKEIKKKKVAVKKVEEIEQTPVEIPFAKAMNTSQNNNEKILSLHKEGKSKMIIAKELGLGVGEVKLVIDLFEGM